MLKGVLKPKWRHPDLAVRRAAVARLTAGDSEILERVALEDQAPAIRRLALRRSANPELLAQRARDDTDAGVREEAGKRYRQLVAGRADDAPALSVRLAIVERCEERALLEHLAREGDEPELRERALERVGRMAVLREVALHDAQLSLRLRALERIDDEATLQRIHERSRKTDKYVSRRAREKLDALVAVRERPERARAECLALCGALEDLGRDGPLERDHALLGEVEARWSEIELEHRATHERRFAAARNAFLGALESRRREEPSLVAAKEAVLEALEARLGTPRDDVIETDEPVRSLEAAAREARAAWDEIPPLPEEAEQPLRERLEAAVTAVRARSRELLGESELRALCEASEKLAARTGVIGEREVKALERRRAAAGPARGSRAPRSLERRLDKAHAALRERLREQVRRKDATLGTLPSQLDELKAAVEAGDAARAVTLHDELAAELEALKAMGTSAERLGALPGRFKVLSPQVGVMRAWDRYGARQAREQLCETMEALVGAEVHPEEIGRRIREARAEWKRLGERDPDVNQSLWRRFDSAARKADEPRRAYSERRAAEREANLGKRRALAERLDAFLETADWSSMDWKAAVRLGREALADWQTASPVDRKRGRSLEKHWHASMTALDQHLDAERQRCLRAREALIEEAKTLLESPDPKRATEECKSLQRRWATTVPTSRGRENDLWKRFRDTCDAVFARRQERFDAERERSRANLEQRAALCDRAEALAQAGADAIDEAARELHCIEGEWRQLGPLPKRGGAAVEKRFARAARAFRDRREALADATRRADLDVLERKAVLCHEAEAAPSGDALEGLRERWQGLPALADAAQERAIKERFERAGTGSDDGAAAAANREAREELCLRMEILAGIDSPPEHAQARMAYQVQRLASALSGATGAGGDDVESLLRAWCLAGPAPREYADGLERRFRRAREAGRSPRS